MLSKISGGRPGAAIVTRKLEAAEPGEIAAWIELPKVPVYFDVSVMQFVCTTTVAATSEPSVTRTMV